MKYVKQFSIILGMSFIGEILKSILPLPIPASIYGLLLMFLALKFQFIRLEQVKETASFLIEIMPIMFIPSAVGLLESWGALKPIWLPIILITIVTTIIVIGVTGWVTEWIMKSRKRGKHANDIK